MSTIRDQIIGALVAQLNGAGKPATVEAMRYSLSKIDFKPDPTKKFLVVYPGKDVVKSPSKGMGLVMRTLVVHVDAWSLGEPIDEKLDQAVSWITKAFSTDQSIGGLAMDIRPFSEEWDEAAAQDGVGLCKSSWEIDYIHNRNNQESLT